MVVVVLAEVAVLVGEHAGTSSMSFLRGLSREGVQMVGMADHKTLACAVPGNDLVAGIAGVVTIPSHFCKDDW